MKRVFVVHGTISKIIRRVIVSDEINYFDFNLIPGETVVEIPFEHFNVRNEEHIQHVQNTIGKPLHNGRCVEINKDDEVVAVYSADPLIDKPIYHPENKIEHHLIAKIGDKKKDNSF